MTKLTDSVQKAEQEAAIHPAPARREPRSPSQVKLEKERRVLEGRSAMAEYEAARRAVQANAERLKGLRLARDAALLASPPPAKTPARRKSVKPA